MFLKDDRERGVKVFRNRRRSEQGFMVLDGAALSVAWPLSALVRCGDGARENKRQRGALAPRAI
jgi:hypothetical protein